MHDDAFGLSYKSWYVLFLVHLHFVHVSLHSGLHTSADDGNNVDR